MLPSHYTKKETQYFCRFTFGQFFTLLVVEIFTLFFLFYLGARYGNELLGLKSSVTVVTQPSGLPEVSATTDKTVTTTQDPEIKALAQDLVQSAQTPDLKRRVAEMLEQNQAAKMNTQPAAEAPEAPANPDAVTLRAAPKPEGAKEEPPTQPEAVIQTAPKARYTIQVGSYPNVEEAHMIVDQWKAKGYPAYLVSADIAGRGRWYRVRVGGFNSKEAAEDFNNKLTTKEQVEAFVVTNE